MWYLKIMTKFWLYWAGLEEEQLKGLVLFQLISTWQERIENTI